MQNLNLISNDLEKENQIKSLIEAFEGLSLSVKDSSFNSFKENMIKTKKKNLVFEGGGAKGLAYSGALVLLSEQGILDDIERVAGSSAGGITAFLLALGYSSKEIKDIVLDTNLVEILEDSPESSGLSKVVNNASKVIVPIYGLTDLAMQKAISLDMQDAFNMTKAATLAVLGSKSYAGAWQGKRFIEYARDLLEKRTGKRSLSFEDLHKLKKSKPELGIKDLYLTGTKVAPQESVVFSHENELTKKVDIIDALRATMSFPFAFEPHPISMNGTTHYFIDGGVLNNYPMDIFDSVDDKGQRIPNPETLGFKIDNKQECADILFTDKGVNHLQEIGHFKVNELDKDVHDYYRYNTIQIFDGNIGTLEFDLNDLGKLILMISGQEATKAYLQNGYLTEPAYENQKIQCLMKLSESLSKKDYTPAEFALEKLANLDKGLGMTAAKLSLKMMDNFTTTENGSTEAHDRFKSLEQVALKISGDVRPSKNQSITNYFDAKSAAVGTAVGGGMAAATFGGALALGLAAPVTVPLVVLGGLVTGASVGISHLMNKSTDNSTAIASQDKEKQVLVDIKNLEITIHSLIGKREYSQAKDLVDRHKEQLAYASIESFHATMQSLTYKSYWASVAVQYDKLEESLKVLMEEKQSTQKKCALAG